MKTITASLEISGAPEKFQILPYGAFEIENEGIAILDEEGMRQVINDFNHRGIDMVIDYEHQTLKDVQAPAAGWIKKLLNLGEKGLWAAAEWTDKARSYLKNREYRYFSPVFLKRKSDNKVIKLHNIGLTNSPKINRLKPIVAKANLPGIEKPFLDETQRMINKLFGIGDEAFHRYAPQDADTDIEKIHREEAFAEVAKMMGITPERIAKYGP